MDREHIEREVARLGPWFHNLDLGGVATAPEHFLGDYPRTKFRRFAHALPTDLRGKSVLDIGCNGGFYSLEMKRRGAARVVGIDSDPAYLAQARFAAEVTGLDVELRLLDVYDVASLRERFDVVLFMGVLYHLRHPLLALDLVHDHVVAEKGTMVFQSMQRGSAEAFEPEPDYPFSDVSLFDLPRAWPATTRHRESEGSSYYRHFYMGLLREDGSPKKALRHFADYTPELGLCQRIHFEDHRLDDLVMWMKRLGVSRLRTGLSWADSHRPGAEAWFDRQMRALEGFDVTLTFCFTPGALGVRDDHTSPPKDPAAFAEFCARMVRRYC